MQIQTLMLSLARAILLVAESGAEAGKDN